MYESTIIMQIRPDHDFSQGRRVGSGRVRKSTGRIRIWSGYEKWTSE